MSAAPAPVIIQQQAPSLLATFGPYVAGLLALAGVALTLWVTGSRERARNLTEREDVHLREQRQTVSKLLGELARFQRYVSNVVSITDLLEFGEEAAGETISDAEDMAREIDRLLIQTRLVVTEPDLTVAVDAVLTSFHTVNLTMVAMLSDLAELAAQCQDRTELSGRLSEMDEAWKRAVDAVRQHAERVNELHAAAIETLAPTVVRDRDEH